MRIAYVTQWFEPEPNVLKGIAFVHALQRLGHEVTVITALPNYPEGRLYAGYRLRLIQREKIKGVSVVRLPIYPSHDSSSVKRSLNFLSFFLAVSIYLALRRSRYDIAYVYHPPITVGLAAALARMPFILDVQDLWPDTIPATGMRGAAHLEGIIGALCHYVYRRASAIVTQSEGMRRALIDRRVPPVKVSVIRNWADAELQGVPERGGNCGPFTLVYGGNLGRAQQLGNLLEAAAILLQERPGILIRLYGSGIDERDLRATALKLKLTNVEFCSRVSAQEISSAFANADALLLHLGDNPLFAITIPSKTQQYLAMGRPIIAAVNGEAAEILKQSGAALVVPAADPIALARAIVEMADAPDFKKDQMGRAGAAFYERHFSFSGAIRRTVALLEDTYGQVVLGQGIK
jgi:glycosyltransferase involved in cell wall biosynthesis